MLQRIQSLYLLIAGLLVIALLHFQPAAFQDKTIATAFSVLEFATAHLAFIAIFLFKKRQKQIRLIYINLVLIAIFYLSLLILAQNFHFSALFPLMSVPFAWLALRAIKKDDELVRSLDRIR